MKTREEMIQELVDDDMEGVRDGSMKDNDRFIYDALLNGRKGYNNFTDKELASEYDLYVKYTEENKKEEEDECM